MVGGFTRKAMGVTNLNALYSLYNCESARNQDDREEKKVGEGGMIADS